MSGPTPGPWVATARLNGTWHIGSPSVGHTVVDTEWTAQMCEADAHLIAAAPDLLAACEELLRELANQASASVDEYVAEGRGGDRAGAAIAKARGHSSWEATR